ncbi:hypothetical protein BDF20DRAFT_845331 [Mycotypha africana]|uniref:uncharacterized protein n=1 Tax=Mycotypha africana TaxID=64632 RepID=UPI0023009E70|nr:uncharacterized protein BDF20DRAFT_845331 [Mycotypha africana]KAI8991571.1 hypothetical protein BDF20DRAFT_845331 [Mycotypha africana]
MLLIQPGIHLSCPFIISMNIARTLLDEVQFKGSSDFIALLSTQQQEFSIERLTICPKCRLQLKEPITMFCGFTLCYSCYHSSNTMGTNKQQCLSFTCLRSHEREKQAFKRNILLSQILAVCSNNNTGIEQKSLEIVCNLLECTICLSTFVQPVTLPSCGHTFCKDCLYLNEHDYCPLCRRKFLYHRNGHKIDQLLSYWVEYISHHQKPFKLLMEAKNTKAVIPFFRIITKASEHPMYKRVLSPLRPQSRCLFHIHLNHQSTRILSTILNQPLRKHYALGAFLSPENENNFKYSKDGFLLKLEHIDHSADGRYTVVQAKVLREVCIQNLTTTTFTTLAAVLSVPSKNDT